MKSLSSDAGTDIVSGSMLKAAVNRRRPKIAATVDPTMLKAVDEWVQSHPGLDRSAVIDEALRLWYARMQEQAMLEQYSAPDEVDPAEFEAWRRVRDAAAQRILFRQADQE